MALIPRKKPPNQKEKSHATVPFTRQLFTSDKNYKGGVRNNTVRPFYSDSRERKKFPAWRFLSEGMYGCLRTFPCATFVARIFCTNQRGGEKCRARVIANHNSLFGKEHSILPTHCNLDQKRYNFSAFMHPFFPPSKLQTVLKFKGTVSQDCRRRQSTPNFPHTTDEE